MTILGYNPEQISSQAPVSVGVLSERVLKAKKEVDGVLGKMRKQERTLLEKKRKIEEIAVMCEKLGIRDVMPFANILREAGDINIKAGDGATLLIDAIFYNHAEVVKLLLAHPDIRVNEECNLRETAFILATRIGNTEMMKLILAHSDASVNKKDLAENTALIWAAHYSHIDNIKLILSDSRLDLREHDQGKKALKATENEEIGVLIKAKMQEQGIKF